MQSDKGFGLCSVTRSSNDAQNVDKDVNDVKVEIEGGKDVLLWRYAVLMLSTHHHLSIIDEVYLRIENSMSTNSFIRVPLENLSQSSGTNAKSSFYTHREQKSSTRGISNMGSLARDESNHNSKDQ